MRRANTAGPDGSVVRSPKNVTSTPVRLMSRSQSRAITSVRLTAATISRPAWGPSGTMCIPMRSRKATNQSNRAGGSMRSTTAVTGMPRTRVSQ